MLEGPKKKTMSMSYQCRKHYKNWWWEIMISASYDEKNLDCTCVLYVYVFYLFSLGFSSWIFFCLYFWYCTNSYWGWGGEVRVMNALVFLEISLIRDSWDLGLNSGLSNNPQGSLKWVALSLGTSVSSFVKWVT